MLKSRSLITGKITAQVFGPDGKIKKFPEHKILKHFPYTIQKIMEVLFKIPISGRDMIVVNHNIVTDDFEMFVAELLSHFPRGFILVMDRWMVHRSGAKRLQRRFSRVDVEWLPPYAPDLNPVEQVWNRSKYTDLANYIPEDIGELEKEVCESISHMRSQQSLLRSFFQKAKLKL